MQAVTACPACGAALKVGALFCGGCGLAVTPGATFASGDGATPDSLPFAAWPKAQPWPFQERSTELARQVIAWLNQSGFSTQSEFGGMLSRMVRAALLDKDIYREAAADFRLHSEAWKVAGLVIILSSFGYLIFSLLSGLPNPMVLVMTFVVQIIAWLARIYLVQLVCSSWLKQRLDFRELFRALSYAQSPLGLRFVPYLGQLVELWALVTTTAAIRDITGQQTTQAVILAVAGFIGGAIVMNVVSGFARAFY
jgi:hypothetical protein